MKLPETVDTHFHFNDLPGQEIEVDIVLTAITFSQGLDQAQKGLLNHHLRVSLLSLYLGQALGLPQNELFELFQAAIIHDLGAVTMKEKQSLLQFDLQDTDHSLRGYNFMQDLPLFRKTAEIIRSHHDRWEGNNCSGLAKEHIPLGSRIINLADRIDVLLRNNLNVLVQRDEVLTRITRHSGEIFDPQLVKLFLEISKKESLWLDLVSPWIAERIISILTDTRQNLKLEELLDVAELFARVVDAKSPYTYNHSHSVAYTTRTISELLGLPERQVFFLNIAGLLHDLGKLTVMTEILDKPGALTKEEMSVMKQHTYYTYWWLKKAFGVTPIAEWAAFHHERLDGTGYPFRKRGADLDLGSRIVAVSDIFAALREDRPYRASLGWDSIEKIMLRQAESGGLDGMIVDVLLQNKDIIDLKWQELNSKAQGE